MNDNTLYEQLKTLQQTELETLVRDVEIELLKPKTSISKTGRDVTFLIWRYRNIRPDVQDWKIRKTPIFTDEAKLLLRQGPYTKGAQYRITAIKNSRGFWQWMDIQPINNETHSDI